MLNLIKISNIENSVLKIVNLIFLIFILLNFNRLYAHPYTLEWNFIELSNYFYGKNFGLKTLVLRAGCITGPAHSSAKLHGFLSYLVKSCLKFKKYNIIGYGGKQVRDNIHSYDLVNCFWNFYKFEYKRGEVYNIGGGREGSCSILEAIDFVENYKKIKIKKNFTKQNRTGDHIWYITSNKKFKKDFPKWKQVYNFKKIIKELIDNY